MTEDQIRKARNELTLVYSIPYAEDLAGTAWEQILTDIKGGTRVPMRDNRPRPDFTTIENGAPVKYSVKTEKLAANTVRPNANAFLGYYEDFIVARPKVDDLLSPNETIVNLGADQLGGRVLEYYNDRLVRGFQWDVLSYLLRVIPTEGNSREFIYWEDRPPTIYTLSDYWWQESGRATGGNRNIIGFPVSIPRDTAPLPPAKFKWTSGGKQFYVVSTIPMDADVWSVAIDQILTTTELREALRQWFRAQKRTAGQPLAT